MGKTDTREVRFATWLAVLWAAGALASHWIGMWWAISGIAISLGAASLVARGELLRARLRPTAGLLLLGFVAGVVMIAATYALYPLAGGLIVSLPAQTAALYALMGRIPPVVSIAMLPFIIIGEELVWRGVVQEALARRLGAGWSVPAAALAYALAHAPSGNLLLTLLALACGAYWSLLRARSGSVLPPLVAHLTWDALVFVLAPLAHPR